MEWRFFFRKDGILEIRATGIFSNGDLVMMAEQVVMDSRWNPGTNALADFREVAVTDMTLSDLLLTLEIHKQFDNVTGKNKIAVIADEKPASLLCLAYEAIAGSLVKSQIKSFEDYWDGIGWVCDKKVIDLNDWR